MNRPHLSRAVLLGLALGLCPLATTRPARAQELTAAQLSEQAYARYEVGDYPGAVAFYMKAYALNVDPRVLFNVAQIYDKKVQDRDLAIEYYRRYLKSTTTEVELVRKATERITELQRQVDERAKTAAPVAPPVATAPPVAPPLAPAPAPVEAGPSPPYWIGYTLGGVLGAGAVVTGALALSSASSLSKLSFTGKTAPADVTSQSSKTRGLALTTDVLIGSAVVSAAVTLIVQLSASKGAKAPKGAPSVGASGTDLVWRF